MRGSRWATRSCTGSTPLASVAPAEGTTEEVVMVWQLVVGAFLVLLPFALLFDLHPDRERLDAQGRPLRRDWPAPAHRPGAVADAGADGHH